MIEPRDYIGRVFAIGSLDCYGIVRDFYRDAFGLELRDYARPSNYHEMRESLYEKYAEAEGFKPFVGSLNDIQYGDILAMNIDAAFVNHVGVYVGEGNMLHHFWGRLSEVCPFTGVWLSRMIGVWRHPEVKPPKSTMNVVEVIPDHVKHRINANRDVPIDWGREDWGDQILRDGPGAGQ